MFISKHRREQAPNTEAGHRRDGTGDHRHRREQKVDTWHWRAEGG